MIVVSERPFTVGQCAIEPVTDMNFKDYRLGFMVLREATADEWLADLEAYGATITRAEREYAANDSIYFYEIATD